MFVIQLKIVANQKLIKSSNNLKKNEIQFKKNIFQFKMNEIHSFIHFKSCNYEELGN